MKRFRLIAVALMLTAAFIGSAFAQTTGKVGVINPEAFEDEKVGIKKLVNAITLVNNEFKVQQTELETLRNKINAVAAEGKKMQEAFAANDKGPIGPAQIQAKQDEFEKLQTEYKRKSEDVGGAYSKRLATVTDPIYAEISKAFQDFVKQQGYSILLDGRPFGRTQENPNGISIFFYVDDKADVTIEFVNFCNTRFAAGGATTTPTKPPATKPQ